MRFSILLLLVAAAHAADLRSTIYSSIIARSGLQSNCSAFSALFTPDGVYESPVGAGAVTGRAAIAAACEQFNALIGPAGSGWYPGSLFSSTNRSAFELQVRMVSRGGCKVDLRGIATVHFDTAAEQLTSFEYHYDGVWEQPDLSGTCA